MATWQANYKDGQGWQDIDEEAVRIEMADLQSAENYETRRDSDGEIKFIDTGAIKYRRIDRTTAPLATKSKVQIEADGDCLWAI